MSEDRKAYRQLITEWEAKGPFTVTTFQQVAGVDDQPPERVRAALESAVRAGLLNKVGRGTYQRAGVKRKATERKPLPSYTFLGTSHDGRPLLIDPKGRLGTFTLYEVPDA